MVFFQSPGGSFSLCCPRKTQLIPDRSFSIAELVSSSVASQLWQYRPASASRIKIYRRDADGAFANRFDPTAGVRPGERVTLRYCGETSLAGPC